MPTHSGRRVLILTAFSPLFSTPTSEECSDPFASLSFHQLYSLNDSIEKVSLPFKIQIFSERMQIKVFSILKKLFVKLL